MDDAASFGVGGLGGGGGGLGGLAPPKLHLKLSSNNLLDFVTHIVVLTFLYYRI